MKLIDVRWVGYTLKGRAECPVCLRTQPYRLYREGLSMGSAMNKALDEVSGMQCTHCSHKHRPSAQRN